MFTGIIEGLGTITGIHSSGKGKQFSITADFSLVWLTAGDAIYGGGLVNEGDLTLSAFTCNYNSVSIPMNAMGDAMGGCIFNTGNLTISGGQFLGNTAGYGGAIYNYENSTATLENINFYENEADTNGGAIWIGVDAEVTNDWSTYDGNLAGLDGGAIWNHGDFDGYGLAFLVMNPLIRAELFTAGWIASPFSATPD